jgi:hypothetical protein
MIRDAHCIRAIRTTGRKNADYALDSAAIERVLQVGFKRFGNGFFWILRTVQTA